MNQHGVKEEASTAIQGCLWGCAIGDAIGLPYEGLSPKKIRRLVRGSLRQRFVFGRGMISDDTEHSLMVASALIEAKFEPAEFSRRFGRSLRAWMLAIPAGVGGATARAICRLLVGMSAERSGVFSAGNGPVMRSAIIGCMLSEEAVLRREIVARSTRITHTDPKAFYSALAIAEIAARLASRQWTVRPELHALKDVLFAVSDDPEWRTLMTDTLKVCSGEHSFQDMVSAMNCTGISGYAYHTTPAVIAAWYLHWGDFRGTIRRLVLAGGDTDSTAAIAGALAGITVGPDVPDDWRGRIFLWPWRDSDVRAIANAQPYREPGGVTELAERTKRSSNSFYKLLGRLREKLRLCVEQQDIFIVQGLVEQANGFRIQLDERCIERTCRHHALDESTVERLRGNNKQRQIIMKRTRSILCPFLLTILVSAPFADAEENPGGDPPNIVFILADDLGFGDLSLDGIYLDGSKGYGPEK